MRLGQAFPAIVAPSTEGCLDLHSYWGDGWGILFSHPADFTPVCTTELGAVANYMAEFTKRNVKLCAISCDPVAQHIEWTTDICAHAGISALGFPIIADEDRKIATQLEMLDPAETNAAGMPMPARAVFVVKPDKTLALLILYPATTGRNFDELLRCVDSLQLTADYSVATPANWVHGDNVMITPAVKPEDTAAKFPKGFEVLPVPSGKAYLRITPQPNIPSYIEVFDPHFHICERHIRTDLVLCIMCTITDTVTAVGASTGDIRENVGYADPTTLFAPAGTDHEGLYDISDLERDWAALPSGFRLSGGVFLEAISCCFKDKSCAELAPVCIHEAQWVAAELTKSPRSLNYFMAATACLEDPNVGGILSQLASNPRVRGIRQALSERHTLFCYYCFSYDTVQLATRLSRHSTYGCVYN